MSTTTDQQHRSVFDGLVLGDVWEQDPARGAWRCGDIGIGLDEQDQTRFSVYALDGGQLFGAQMPLPGGPRGDFDWFRAVLDSVACEGVPNAGLEAWFDLAQPLSDDAAAQAIEQIQREREEWERNRKGRTGAELLVEVPEKVNWIVPRMLAPGWLTKLAAREKVGKGKFITVAIGQMERGEDSIFGPGPGYPVTAVIFSEEPMDSIREKIVDAGVLKSRVIYGWELAHMTWEEKIAYLVNECLVDGHRVLFIDNVSRSAGLDTDAENGVGLARAVEQLQEAGRSAGLALVIDHHHKKGGGPIEDKSRGGTALPGATDINIEMERVGGRESRKRRLVSQGRMAECFWTMCVELSEDRSHYVPVDDDGSDGDDDAQYVADKLLLGGMGGRATASEFKVVIGRSERTARTRLNRLVTEGLALVERGEMTDKGLTPSIYVIAQVEPSEAETHTSLPMASDGSSG